MATLFCGWWQVLPSRSKGKKRVSNANINVKLPLDDSSLSVETGSHDGTGNMLEVSPLGHGNRMWKRAASLNHNNNSSFCLLRAC